MCMASQNLTNGLLLSKMCLLCEHLLLLSCQHVEGTLVMKTQLHVHYSKGKP